MEDIELLQRDAAGRVVLRAQMLDGELDGELVQYDAAGAVLATMSFKRGKLDGDALFYDGGKLKVQLRYRDGAQEGESILYGDDGTALPK